MPNETGTETIRSDATGVDDSLFGDAADTTAAAPAGEQDSFGKTEQDKEIPEDAKTAEVEEETARDPQGADDAGHTPTEGPQGLDDAEEDALEEGLKVVLSIKGARAVIGVQQPSSDPHIEVFDDHDLPGLTQEVPAVVERARAGWEESPKHPAYERPAPPARRRNRRGQETAQAANAGGEAETEQTQQQTLRLF